MRLLVQLQRMTDDDTGNDNDHKADCHNQGKANVQKSQ